MIEKYYDEKEYYKIPVIFQAIDRQFCYFLYRQNYCHEESIDDLYLLTTTAEKYFLKFGFNKIEKISAPELIKQTEEFKSICPESAVFMHKHI